MPTKYSNLGISTFLTTHYFTGAKSTLIAAIEGGDGPTKDLYLVGTVNKKWLLDEAFLSRAVQFYVPLPSQDQIEAQISYTIAKEQDEADLVKWDVKEKGIERLAKYMWGKHFSGNECSDNTGCTKPKVFRFCI